MVDKVDWIWHNGKLIRWDDARIHLMTHSLHYGLAVFEGVRAYNTVNGTAIGSAILVSGQASITIPKSLFAGPATVTATPAGRGAAISSGPPPRPCVRS